MEAEEIVVALVERGGRYLVQKRHGDPALGAVWEFPGGKVEPGENHAAALRREVAEETGLVVEVGARVISLGHVYPDRRVVLHAYLGAPAEGASPILAADAAWLTPPEIRARPVPAANPPILDALEWGLARALDANSSMSYK